MKLPFFSLFKIITEGKSAYRFLFGAIASFSFSIAVILCAVGLMDGFESTLIKSLRQSNGDITVKSYKGFYSKKNAKQLESKSYLTSSFVLGQSFAVFNNRSKGVLVHGIDSDFSKITGLKLKKIKADEVILGKEFENLGVSKGDEISLLFSTKKTSSQGIPELKFYNVAGFVSHGIHEKDSRFIYMNRAELNSVLGYNMNAYNASLLKFPGEFEREKVLSTIDSLSEKFKETDFHFTPFWKEYGTLIEAVEVEKMSITTILQLIVIVAIFNVLAFVIFVLEKQSQSFFLLRALGLGQRALTKFWIYLLLFMWTLSCIFSVILAFAFNFLLQNLSFFQLPGDIYVLSKLHLDLNMYDYLSVFGIALIWILLIGFVSVYRLKKKALLFGLRQEFS